jgi:hypothetical protein
MPKTRTQKRKADEEDAASSIKIIVVDDPPVAAKISTANLLSSVPGLSIADVRMALSEQRRLYQEKGFVNWHETVLPNHSMSRLEFNFQYVNGVARKRLDKHKRVSAGKEAKI